MRDWFSPLFFLFARADEELLRRQILFLKAELEMTRKRVEKQRIFLNNEERQRLLELGDGIGSGVFEVDLHRAPKNLPQMAGEQKPRQAAHQEDGQKRYFRNHTADSGSLSQRKSVGDGRIVGELRKLRIRCCGRTNVRTILKEEGLHPGPKRGHGTWDEFLKIHADTLWQCDFFSKMVMTSRGLRQAYVAK